MSRYTNWLKRKEHATPYADEAFCRKCKYGEWVRTSVFCKSTGRPKKMPMSAWFLEEPSYCPEYMPIGVTENHCQRCGKAVKEGVELCDKCMYEAQEETEVKELT